MVSSLTPIPGESLPLVVSVPIETARSARSLQAGIEKERGAVPPIGTAQREGGFSGRELPGSIAELILASVRL